MLYFSGLPAQAQYGGGTGMADDPFLIYTAEQMNSIGLHEEDWDKHFKLMADIDLAGFTGTDFNMIGSWPDWYDAEPFIGVFDGNGHTISNFSYTSTDSDAIGLFRRFSGTIKDLGLINPNVNAGTYDYVGSLVAHVWLGTINNCYAQGGSVSGDAVIGGLVGLNDGTITNCYSNSSVSGHNWIGGLGGANRDTVTRCHVNDGSIAGEQMVGGLMGRNEGVITNCYATGSISRGTEGQVGGLVGLNWEGTITNCYATTSALVTGLFVGGLVGNNKATIIDCYAAGGVTGRNHIAGLVGENAGTITTCYATGGVGVPGGSGNAPYIGGLVGSKEEGSVVDHSFWDTQTSGQLNSNGGTGKSTVEMKMADTFVSAGWDFDTPIWKIDEGVDYPKLWWEQQPSEYGGGSGTAEDPFLIHTAQQMNTIGAYSNDWDKHFKLMADIDLRTFTGTDFNIIGYYISDDDKKPFAGVFDGNDHTISNFAYSSADRDFAGLFGYIESPNTEIKDLGLIDPNLDTNGWFVGSLVGYNLGGNINGCYTQGGTVSGAVRVGGLVGLNDGTINDCYSTCSVFGGGDVAGMVGLNTSTLTMCYSQGSVSGITNVAGLVGQNDGTIIACYATGSVTGSVQTAGGLVGFNENGNISDCYATGNVEGDLLVGGLAGWNFGIITRCYSIGSVTGNREVGGLVGLNQNTVTLSCWNVSTSGQTTSSGGAGLTTSEMQIESIFTNSGWDFMDEAENGTEDIWWIIEGQDYPRLWWETDNN